MSTSHQQERPEHKRSDQPCGFIRQTILLSPLRYRRTSKIKFRKPKYARPLHMLDSSIRQKMNAVNRIGRGGVSNQVPTPPIAKCKRTIKIWNVARRSIAADL